MINQSCFETFRLVVKFYAENIFFLLKITGNSKQQISQTYKAIIFINCSLIRQIFQMCVCAFLQILKRFCNHYIWLIKMKTIKPIIEPSQFSSCLYGYIFHKGPWSYIDEKKKTLSAIKPMSFNSSINSETSNNNKNVKPQFKVTKANFQLRNSLALLSKSDENDFSNIENGLHVLQLKARQKSAIQFEWNEIKTEASFFEGQQNIPSDEQVTLEDDSQTEQILPQIKN